ncbi:Membrane-associated enzyme, PAP2 (Acid phosphatase) superfamily [Burkholderiales bacterium 8X]|nr:Membrane-associated enzyme, PAP2 (Acid phosphatase) superfamily [Burkholderiales bacterium 8X]
MTRNEDAGRIATWTFAMLALLLAWDASGLDLALARLAGTPAGFPLRSNFFLVAVMHEAARFASWALLLMLFAGACRPMGLLRRLGTGDRWQLAISALASIAVVSSIKSHSATSCPWDLDLFGGVARHVSHWSWGLDDGGSGRCFPAGHASAAFAYVGGYFVWRRRFPTIARRWLATALAFGFALGFAQQLRGAHYLSHTLWTGSICWSTGWAIDGIRHGLAHLAGLGWLRPTANRRSRR